ncbi:unnamed protein product, partial [Staurois parvus]
MCSTRSPFLPKGQQSLGHPCTVCRLWSSPVLSAVSGHQYCVRSLWSSHVLYAVSGHLYCVGSLWSSPVLSAVSGHLLYCLQSLVICTVSA